MTEHEEGVLRAAISMHETTVGADVFRLGWNWEIHPTPERADFSAEVKSVIVETLGFKRAIRVCGGPFYYRPVVDP